MLKIRKLFNFIKTRWRKKQTVDALENAIALLFMHGKPYAVGLHPQTLKKMTRGRIKIIVLLNRFQRFGVKVAMDNSYKEGEIRKLTKSQYDKLLTRTK